MANNGEQSDIIGWANLLLSSSKLLDLDAPSALFPTLQRNIDQLEASSNKLKPKKLRAETPSQSIAATRLLAREGLNTEQLARDLKSFEFKDSVHVSLIRGALPIYIVVRTARDMAIE